MSDWVPLRDALARCRTNNIAVPIWWRDDDAIEPTYALDQLSAMSQSLGVPIHLAVIPKTAQAELVTYAKDRPNLVPCIHGWSHENTAPTGLKKSEFGVPRKDGATDLQSAISHMNHLFERDLLSLFVPPWNRIDASFEFELKRLGYAGLSTFGPRVRTTEFPQINTHIDPIFWRGHRGLVSPDVLISQATEILNARCEGDQDAAEPFGFLTHHLVHVPEVWEFSKAFICEILDGGAYPANLREILK